MIRKDFKDLRRLASDGKSYDPAWSPRDDQIAFVSFAGVAVLTVATGKIRMVAGLQAWPGGNGGECAYSEFETSNVVAERCRHSIGVG